MMIYSETLELARKLIVNSTFHSEFVDRTMSEKQWVEGVRKFAMSYDEIVNKSIVHHMDAANKTRTIQLGTSKVNLRRNDRLTVQGKNAELKFEID